MTPAPLPRYLRFMLKFALIIALNLAFLAWVITLIIRDPANVWKRRDRVPPADAPRPDEPDAG